MPLNPKELPRVWAVVVAAGSGRRFGSPLPKQFLKVAGVPLLARTLRALGCCSEIEGMVVVVPKDWVDSNLVIPPELKNSMEIKMVAGRQQRSGSVQAGLDQLPAGCNLVLVHDGVRPSVSPVLVSRVVAGAWQHGACIPVLPEFETIKEVDAGGLVVRTLERERLRLVQTPQGFRREVLVEAYRWADGQGVRPDYPDDAALVEESGKKVTTVPGEPGNIKLTVPADLARLGLAVPRVGYGYDVHRLVPGRKLMLGGVEVSHETGLMGHSDGDAALHALCDAILGAAGLGDIGRHFPDDDPRFQGAASLELLRVVSEKVHRAGWRVSSVDLTVVAQKPRLVDYLPRMAQAVAEVLGIVPEAVGVKATTEEGLGFTGSGEGIAAHAVAVLVSGESQP